MPSTDYKRNASNIQKTGRTKRVILEILVSALLIIPAIVVSVLLKDFLIKKTLKSIKLVPNSSAYELWLNPPVTTERSYYLYNITNPIDVVTDPSSAPLRLKETPPYVYNIDTKKTNITWSNNNEDLTYSVERVFTRHPTRFNPSSVNDTGTFVDMLRATFRSQFQMKAAQPFFDISGYNTFYHRNAVEQLEGFTSPLFYAMQDKMTGPNTAKSGFIYRYNGSRLYNVTIKAGLMDKGQVLTLDNEVVPFSIPSPSRYDFPIYDGLTFAPMLFDKPSLNIFQVDFCSPVRIQYVKTVRMHTVVDMHQYTIKLVDYNNCTNSSDPITCAIVDKIDVSKCISASLPEKTVFLSKAHFYGSSSETIEEMNIEGFTPTEDKHESYIYFEPYSGTPFKAISRMQLNIDTLVDPMRQSEEGGGLEKTTRKAVRRLLPIFWIDQNVSINDKYIKRLQILYIGLHYGKWIIMGLAIGLSIGFITVMEFLAKRAAKKGPYTLAPYI